LVVRKKPSGSRRISEREPVSIGQKKNQRKLEGRCMRCNHKIDRGHHEKCPDQLLTKKEKLAKALEGLRKTVILNNYADLEWDQIHGHWEIDR